MKRLFCLYLLTLVSTFSAFSQIAGQNVNMVSGTQWPNGDPFLQRQNEPSMAVSSRNPLHLLAGANDYRTVDLPGLPVGETGDAWLGIFKSYDGGQTWTSTVHPGCQQNVPQCAGAPTLKGFSAGADPVVRPGSNGMFYYSGIAFTRAATSKSVVFVSRFIDNNNEENGDPIKYMDTTVVTTAGTGTFVDKPWLAVDVPRQGAGSCTIKAPQTLGAPVTQTFAAGNLYVAYTTFVNDEQPPSQVMFTRSKDCGLTWSNPIGLSDTTVNQGASIAIDPISGAVYVAWRRFQNGSLSDAILISKSTDGGQTFNTPVQIASISTFDQATSAYSFRTNDYPSITVDGSGRVYAAWSERNAGQAASGGDARIVLSTSHDGQTWTKRVPIDDYAGRGHQFMPAITAAGGKVMVVYYDLREDNTVGNFSPVGGGQYLEFRAPAGDLATTPPHPEKVFTPFVLDAAPASLMEGGLLRRHTVDVWGALADVADSPYFTTARISQYEFGSRQDSPIIEQLQVDPPNFPLFSQGTEPFFGDYLDVAAAPSIVPGAQAGTWKFNTDPSPSTSFHAVWTDNRDVRPPADGNWTNYTPPVSKSITGTSIFDPTQPQPICVTGQTGMRNQNIYTAPVSQGLVVGSPSNSKTLGIVQRAFPVVVQNTTDRTHSYRLTIANQPPGGQASFLEFPVPGLPSPLTTLDISVGPISSASRMVFVSSNDPTAAVLVGIAEISAPGADVVLPGGQSGTVLLNPDPLNPTNPTTTSNDIFNPAIANPAIANPAIANPAIANPDIANPAIANPAIANPDIANLGVANPDIANPAIANPDIANPAIANPDIANAAITDASWPLSNTGTTTATYSLHFIIDKLIPRNVKAQLIITRIYNTPEANGCSLVEQPQPVVLANNSHPEFTSQQTLSQSSLGKMLASILRRANRRPGAVHPEDTSTTIIDVTDSSADNTTITIGPGETVYVTLRFFNSDSSLPLGFDPGTDITTVSISQSTNTGGSQPPIASSKLFAASGSLPPAVSGNAYDATLQASGGTTPYTFALVSGNLPPGLSLNGGEISGTVSGGSGAYGFTVQVTDSSPTPQTVTENLNISVTAVNLAVTGLSATGSGGSTAKAGDTITINTTISNSGSAANGVSPVISLVSTGTASASCNAVSPSSANIPAGGSQNFTIQCGNISGAGTLAFAVSISGTDASTGVSLSVTPATSNPITVLGAPPTVTVEATSGGAPYAPGTWTNQPVTVSFTCTTAGGAVSTQNLTVGSQGANQTVSTSCTDPAGNSTPASFGGINIDFTPPVVTATATVNGISYGGAVVNSPVTVTFNCTDSGGSGVVSPPAPVTISSTGVNQSASGTCRDSAGNSATATFSPINVIIGAPQFSFTMTSAGGAYSAGAWSNQPVTVTFNCAVAGGLSPQSVTPTTVISQGSNQFVNGTCVDPAGNRAQVTAGPINVNTGQPTLNRTSISPSASNGWYRSAVTITWQCFDRVDGTNTTISKTASSEGANQTVTASCTNLAGTTVTASQTVSIDMTPPTLTATPSTQANANGWYNGPVTVNFNCTDALSGVASTPPSQTFSNDGRGMTATGTCTDVAGNSATVSSAAINIDRTAPVAQFVSISPQPNGAGWSNAAATVTFACLDSGSGPVSSTVTRTVSQNGAGQSATATCTDLAGNTGTATRSGINVDASVPTLTATPTSAPNSNGWWSGPVTISFTCTDPVSGVTTQPQSQTFSANVKGGSATASCTSIAGNTATTTYTPINIETTSPSILFSSITAPSRGIWNNTPVTVTWTCSDALSGVVSGAVSQAVSTEGSGQSVRGTCSNLAGFSASDGRSGINIDLTAPQIQILSPVNGFAYPQGTTIAASYSCSDGLSGVLSCSGPVSSGSRFTLNTPGTFTFTVNAQDQAGNPNTQTVTYTVTPKN